MRTKPILGNKLWFGPRGWGGWGWMPVSWEGWVTLAVFVAATLVVAAVMDDADAFTPIFLITAALVLVCWLKGTSPGGPAARRRLQIQREREADSDDPGYHERKRA